MSRVLAYSFQRLLLRSFDGVVVHPRPFYYVEWHLALTEVIIRGFIIGFSYSFVHFILALLLCMVQVDISGP